MRRLALILLASSSMAAFAQVRGTPASVTSVGSTPVGRIVPNGVPASVTSLGPRGFQPGLNPLFPHTGPLTNPLQPTSAFPVHHRGHRGNAIPVYVPVYYGGYYYDPYTYYDQQPQQQVVERAVEKETQPQRLEIVVVDKREEETKQAAANEQALKEAAEPKHSTLNEPSEIPAIFIFKDGSRKELGNFAIMANTLYDLTENRVRKIALNTVDRDATLAENAKIGRDIQLP